MERIERQYDIASVGRLYWKSLELFAIRLESQDGQMLSQENVEIAEKFIVIFPSGTGYTRTSGIRIR